jgi:hypothetical protein
MKGMKGVRREKQEPQQPPEKLVTSVPENWYKVK